MRVVTPEGVGVEGVSVVVVTAIAAVLLSACNLREGDSSEYGKAVGGYDFNVEKVTNHKSLGKSGVAE